MNPVWITPNILRIDLKVPVTPSEIATCLIKSNDNLAILDTGLGRRPFKDISRGMMEQGLNMEDITHIINTHFHVEHIGGNYQIQKASGAKIFAHEVDAVNIEQPKKIVELCKTMGDVPRRSQYMAELYMKGVTRSIKPTQVDRKLRDGDIIDLGTIKLKVIHTPGHSPGHICLYDQDTKIMFSGDVVCGGDQTVYVGPPSGDMIQYLDTLNMIRDINPELILPAHGPIVTDPIARVDDLIRRKLQRERDVIHTLTDNGEMTPGSITKRVYGVLSAFDFVMATGAVMGHLDKLRIEGRVERVEKYGKVLYHLV